MFLSFGFWLLLVVFVVAGFALCVLLIVCGACCFVCWFVYLFCYLLCCWVCVFWFGVLWCSCDSLFVGLICVLCLGCLTDDCLCFRLVLFVFCLLCVLLFLIWYLVVYLTVGCAVDCLFGFIAGLLFVLVGCWHLHCVWFVCYLWLIW